MRKADQKIDACVYCGSTEDLTRDHIPPKALFPRPRPSNLITVPCCGTCNTAASLDDEYFWAMLAMRHDTGDHPAARAILPNVLRSLQKQRKTGFRRALFNSMREVEVLTTGGIFLGTASTYDVDLSRLDRVAGRIVTGLYYEKLGSRIGPDMYVKVYSSDGLNNIDPNAKLRVLDIFDRVTRNQPHTLGDGVFTYWFQQIQDHDTASVWVIAFYERVSFLCLVTPKREAA